MKVLLKLIIGIIITAVLFVVSLYLMFAFGSPDKTRYYGDYPEHFSVAIYSLLGVTSEWGNRRVEILEEDSEERVMFAFSSSDFEGIDGRGEAYSVMITQKTGSRFAYFYPDYNFVARHSEAEITEADIEQLKRDNDWNEPLNEAKMIRVRTIRKKTGVVSGSYVDSAVHRAAESDPLTEGISMAPLGRDMDGRWLYYVYVFKYNGDILRDFRDFLRAYMLICDPSSGKVYDIELIDDVWNYQDQLREFKGRNGWELYAE